MATIANLLINLTVGTGQMTAGLGRGIMLLNRFDKQARGLRQPLIAATFAMQNFAQSGGGIQGLISSVTGLGFRLGGLVGAVAGLAGAGLIAWFSRSAKQAGEFNDRLRETLQLVQSGRSGLAASGSAVGEDLAERIRVANSAIDDAIKEQNRLMQRRDELMREWFKSDKDKRELNTIDHALKEQNKTLAQAQGILSKATSEIGALWDRIGASTPLDQRVKALEKLIDVVRELLKANPNGTTIDIGGRMFRVDTASLQWLTDLLKKIGDPEAIAFVEGLATEWQKFVKEIEKAQDLFSRGLITRDQLERGEQLAIEAFQQAQGAIAAKSIVSTQTGLGAFKVGGPGAAGQATEETAKRAEKHQQKIERNTKDTADNTKALSGAFAPFGP